MSSSQPIIRRYMPELDSLRGLAILAVLFYHGIAPLVTSHWTPAERILLAVSGYGWVGVNLFFVLSGFLITGILIDSKHHPHYYSHFYARRALRILPALWCTLLLLLLCGSIDWRFFGLSALFLANGATFFGLSLQYGPLWSLAVEEHFYFLWPALVRRLERRGWILIAVLIIFLTPLVRWIGYEHAGRPEAYFSLYTWGNLDGLALGAMLAMWVRSPLFRREQLSRVAIPALFAGIAACFLSVRLPLTRATLFATGCNVAALGLVSCALLIGSSQKRTLADRPVLRFFGWISYGLYLIHVFAFHVIDLAFGRWWAMLQPFHRPVFAILVRFVLGSGFAISLAYLSRRSLEAWFLSMGSRYQRIPDPRRDPWLPTPVYPDVLAKE